MTATNIASRRGSLARRCSARGGCPSASAHPAPRRSDAEEPNPAHDRHHPKQGGRSEEEWKSRYDELNDTIATLTTRLAALKAAEEKEARPRGSAPSSAKTTAADSAQYRYQSSHVGADRRPSAAGGRRAGADRGESCSEVVSLPPQSLSSSASNDRRYRPSRRYDPVAEPAATATSETEPTTSSTRTTMKTKRRSRAALAFTEDEEHRRKYSSSAAASCAAAYASRYAARSSAYRARRESRNCLAAAASSGPSGDKSAAAAASSNRAAMIVARMRSKDAAEEQEKERSHHKSDRRRRPQDEIKDDGGGDIKSVPLAASGDSDSGSSSTSTTVPLEQDEPEEYCYASERRDSVGDLPESTPDRHSRGRRAGTGGPGKAETNARRPSLQAKIPPRHSRTEFAAPQRRASSASSSRSSRTITTTAGSARPVRREASMLLGNAWMIDQPNSALGKLCRGCEFHRCSCVERERGDWGCWVRIDEPAAGVTLPRDIIHFMGTKRGD